MLNNVNHLLLVGVLTQDANITLTKGNEAMAILKVGTTDEWVIENEVKKITKWNSVFFFGEKALACKHYKKGMIVHITAEVYERSVGDGVEAITKTIVRGRSIFVLDLGNTNRPGQESHVETI